MFALISLMSQQNHKAENFSVLC